MDTSLIPIKGISRATETKLAAAGITDIPSLLEKAAAPEARAALAVKLKVSEKFIYSWVKQSELLRVEGMTADAADLLVKIGVRDVEDLARLNVEMALPLMKSNSDAVSPGIKDFPTKEKLTAWKNRAVTMRPFITRDPGEPVPVVILAPPAERTGEDASPARSAVSETFFYDMGDVIASVGRGIAEAQQALDMSAILTQQQINDDDDLRAWGISAQWFTIPEATVNLKMNYQFTQEKVEEGSVGANRKTRLLVSPINAKYTNTFKVSETLQSELNLKFLPIPAPTRWTEQITVPDLSGMTLAEVKEHIAAIGMKLGDVELGAGVTEGEGIVASQSPPEGSRVWLAEKAHIRLEAPKPEPPQESAPESGPEPESAPESGPAPAPEPESAPENGSVPAPEPESAPESGPAPVPEPESAPEDGSVPAPVPESASEDGSAPAPESEPDNGSEPTIKGGNS